MKYLLLFILFLFIACEREGTIFEVYQNNILINKECNYYMSRIPIYYKHGFFFKNTFKKCIPLGPYIGGAYKEIEK